MMLSRLWWFMRADVETFMQYRALARAIVTEAIEATQQEGWSLRAGRPATTSKRECSSLPGPLPGDAKKIGSHVEALSVT